VYIYYSWEPILELRGDTCQMGSPAVRHGKRAPR